METRFKEREIAACEEGAGLLGYPKSIRLKARDQCPSGKLRCCFYCDLACEKRCDTLRLLETQPRRVLEHFNCPRLRTPEEIAWKFLLGVNVPKIK